MKRIGIVRLSALGDVIVSASFLPMLCEKLGCEADWFVDERFAPILQDCPYIKNLYALPLKRVFKERDFGALKQMYQMLRGLSKYERVFDLQGLVKSAIVGKILHSQVFIGFDWRSIKEKLASLFYTQKVKIGYGENILKRNADLLGLCLKEFSPRKEVFGFSFQAKQKIEALLQGEKPKVLLILEASKPEKMYPASAFLHLCKLNPEVEFLILYHQYPTNAMKFSSLNNARVLPLLSLDEVKALMSVVDLAIGGDTGITHLAWAMQKPSITLYGNTPMERFRLDGGENISLSGNPGANYVKGDFSIAKISPESITRALRALL